MFDDEMFSVTMNLCGLAIKEGEQYPERNNVGIAWLGGEFYNVMKEMNLTEEQREIFLNHIPCKY